MNHGKYKLVFSKMYFTRYIWSVALKKCFNPHVRGKGKKNMMLNKQELHFIRLYYSWALLLNQTLQYSLCACQSFWEMSSICRVNLTSRRLPLV